MIEVTNRRSILPLPVTLDSFQCARHLALLRLHSRGSTTKKVAALVGDHGSAQVHVIVAATTVAASSFHVDVRGLPERGDENGQEARP